MHQASALLGREAHWLAEQLTQSQQHALRDEGLLVRTRPAINWRGREIRVDRKVAHEHHASSVDVPAEVQDLLQLVDGQLGEDHVETGQRPVDVVDRIGKRLQYVADRIAHSAGEDNLIECLDCSGSCRPDGAILADSAILTDSIM